MEIRDASDFDPWETLHRETVRVIGCRQHKPDGAVVQAGWFIDWPARQAGSLSQCHMAKSRWQIENQAFNDAGNTPGLEQIYHPEANSLLPDWPLNYLALVIGRFHRIRYPHPGAHPVRSAEALCRHLWLAISRGPAPGSSEQPARLLFFPVRPAQIAASHTKRGSGKNRPRNRPDHAEALHSFPPARQPGLLCTPSSRSSVTAAGAIRGLTHSEYAGIFGYKLAGGFRSREATSANVH